MSDAWDAAKSKGADIAEDAVDAVRSRPLTATGVVAAIALFLAREPLIDFAGKLVTRQAATKRKPRKKKQTKRRQSMTDQDKSATPAKARGSARSRLMKAPSAGHRHACRSAADRACRRDRRRAR